MSDKKQTFENYLKDVDAMLQEQYGGSVNNIDQRMIISCFDKEGSIQLCVQKIAVRYSLEATKDEYRVKTELIRSQNDFFRTAPTTSDASGIKGTVVVTRSIMELPKEAQAELIEKVIAFDEFSEENDPHEEHDFGAFDFRGDKIFWKIDYYDPKLETGSPDPADLMQTKRVLTIMFAHEY